MRNGIGRLLTERNREKASPGSTKALRSRSSRSLCRFVPLFLSIRCLDIGIEPRDVRETAHTDLFAAGTGSALGTAARADENSRLRCCDQFTQSRALGSV